MKKSRSLLPFVLILLFACPSFLRAATAVTAAVEQGEDHEAARTGDAFDGAAQTVKRELAESLRELSALREQISNEKIPLSRKLRDLESELLQVRLNYQQTSRLLDSRTLDLTNLGNEIKSREEEALYLSNLMSEYIRNFESRLHIAETQRYKEQISEAKLAPENTNLSGQEIFKAQAGLVLTSVARLNNAAGGTRFQGTAVDEAGRIKRGSFVLLGPVALFMSDDGKDIGMAEQRMGSLEPAVIDFESEEDAKAAQQVILNSVGFFPLDPTLGNAHKIAETKESFVEHVKKGGPVMVPIFLLAGAALAVALFKWFQLRTVRTATDDEIKSLLASVASHDQKAALRQAKVISGPVGKMLASGVEHLNEKRRLIEEVMYETVMEARLKLNSLLPFIAISASSAPLLGLLGTVTGIINTFKLITVFGSGDVKMLSGGISEALITTKFGLIVAIPSLLIHAYLSRRTRGVIDEMEKAAVAFINQVSKTPMEEKKRTGTNEVRRESSSELNPVS